MNKHFVITSNSKNSWQSCNIISSNLFECYKKLNYTILQIPNIDTDQDETKRFFEILNEDALHEKTITFLDSEPFPFVVLSKLIEKIKNVKQVSFYIHLYGDFTYFSREWISCLDRLPATIKLHFFVASSAQKRLVEKLLDNYKNISIIPFPISNKFSYVPNEFKKEIGLPPTEKVLLSVSRLHLQKNIDVVIDVFLEYVNSNQIDDLTLLIIGDYDHKSGMQPELPEFYLFQKYDSIFNKHKQKRKEKIVFLGPIEHEQLPLYYSMANGFISLSLYHDEDYGMSVGEAVLSGLPCCLTSWGGYLDFKKSSNNIFFADTFFSDHGYSINVKVVNEFFNYITNQENKNLVDRAIISRNSQEMLSVTNISTDLGRVYQAGVSCHLLKYEGLKKFDLIRNKIGHSFFQDTLSPVENSLYNLFYSSYLCPDESEPSDCPRDSYRVVSWVGDYLRTGKSRKEKFFSTFFYSNFNQQVPLIEFYIQAVVDSKPIVFVLDSLDRILPALLGEKILIEGSGIVALSTKNLPNKQIKNLKEIVYFDLEVKTLPKKVNNILLHIVLESTTLVRELSYFKEIEKAYLNSVNDFYIILTDLRPMGDRLLTSQSTTILLSYLQKIKYKYTLVDRLELKKLAFDKFNYLEINSRKNISLSDVELFALSKGSAPLRLAKENSDVCKPINRIYVSEHLCVNLYKE